MGPSGERSPPPACGPSGRRGRGQAQRRAARTRVAPPGRGAAPRGSPQGGRSVRSAVHPALAPITGRGSRVAPPPPPSLPGETRARGGGGEAILATTIPAEVRAYPVCTGPSRRRPPNQGGGARRGVPQNPRVGRPAAHPLSAVAHRRPSENHALGYEAAEMLGAHWLIQNETSAFFKTIRRPDFRWKDFGFCSMNKGCLFPETSIAP